MTGTETQSAPITAADVRDAEQRGYDRGYQKAYDGIRRDGGVFTDVEQALRAMAAAAQRVNRETSWTSPRVVVHTMWEAYEALTSALSQSFAALRRVDALTRAAPPRESRTWTCPDCACANIPERVECHGCFYRRPATEPAS